LRGIKEPEEERRIIGEEFIRVFEEVAEKIEYLIQEQFTLIGSSQGSKGFQTRLRPITMWLASQQGSSLRK
jgi:GMP synthase PP-ATPase subunit